MKNRNNRRAFTIVELVIVVAVIAVLAVVLIPTFGNVIDKAQESRALREAKNAYTQYFIDHAAEGGIPEYMFYDADGRWVSLHNGTPVDVFKSAYAAITAMGLNSEAGIIAIGNKLYILAILADDTNNDIGFGPIEPVEPDEPVPPPPADATRYTVTTNLPDYVTLQGDSTVLAGSSYSATLIWKDGHVPQVVKVVMDGYDISSDYPSSVITIPKVTGDIHIVAVGRKIGWHAGTISMEDGSILDDTGSYRIYSDLIDVSLGATISVANPESGATYCPVFYTADGTTFMYAPDNFVSESLTLFPGQYKHMRLMVRDEELEPLTPDYGENIRIAVGTTDLMWVTGSIDPTDGHHLPIPSKDPIEPFIRSGFFDLRQGLVVVNSSSPYFNVSYYDENMNIIPDAYSGYKTNWNSKAFSRAVYARIVAKARSADTGTKSITVTFTES